MLGSTTLVLLLLVAAGLGCGADAAASVASECEEAAAALASCGASTGESPFGTCRPVQHDQALGLVSVDGAGGWGGLRGRKAGGGLWSALPVLWGGDGVREVAAFPTDGCSAFPDGTLSDATLWQHCCVEHDLAYYAGGN